MEEKPISGTQAVGILRKKYGVCRETWMKWIAKVPNLDHTPGQRAYTPAQVSKIINHLGNPG